MLGFTQSGFKTFHVWRLHSILGQPAPLLHCRVGQDISFLIYSELLSSHYALCLWADAPNPDLGILVVLHWVTPLWQYLCTIPWAFFPQGRILHLSWQNFSQVPSACSSSLPRSCCKTALPLSVLTNPSSLVLPEHLSRVHSTSSRSLMQILNRTGVDYWPPSTGTMNP